MDSNNIDVTESTQEGVSRRTIVKIGAWSVPAVAAGFAVPAAAASPSEEGPSLPEAVAEFGVGLNGGRGTPIPIDEQWNADKTVFYTQYGPSMHVRLKVGTQPLPEGTIITFTFKPIDEGQVWNTNWGPGLNFWGRSDTDGADDRRAYFNRPATSVVGATTTTMAQSDVPAGTVIDFLVGSIVNPADDAFAGGEFSATITLPGGGGSLTLPANGLADSDGTDFTYETFKGAYLYQEAHQAVTSPGDITSLVMQVMGPGTDGDSSNPSGP